VKKIFGVILGVLALAGVASADPVQCGVAPVLFTTLIEQGGCETGDYNFTNFVVVSGTGLDGVGTIDANTANVTATFSIYGPLNATTTMDLHDTSGFGSNFTLTYTVALDQTQPPASLQPAGTYDISKGYAGLQVDGGGSDSATWQQDIYTTGATFLGTDLVTATDSGSNSTGAINFRQLALNITDTYIVTDFGGSAGHIIDLSNTYTESAAEPSTMVLLGVALIGLGVFFRKRRKACA
jgi:hypothetical protein